MLVIAMREKRAPAPSPRPPKGADDGPVNHHLREDLMASTTLVDIADRRRSAATLPGYQHGRPPRNKRLQYPADPPTVEEIIAAMRAAGDHADGVRLRGLIIVRMRIVPGPAARR
jgi:hypothetical protein